jgi:hypothetical protein
MFISYSLWGSNKVYTYGIVENVILASTLYHGWIVRVHHNDTVPENILQWLREQPNVQLIHHPGTELKASNMFWRFEDFFLPNTTVIVRDADSRISPREVRLVNEWLASDKNFHVIRDHDTHTVPIMGCSGGCRNNCLEYMHAKSNANNVNECPLVFFKSEDFLKDFLKNMPSDADKYNIDQIFLYHYVYPLIVGNLMVHSVAKNAYEPFAKVIEPVEKGFVGSIVTECKEASKIFGDDQTDFERVAAY